MELVQMDAVMAEERGGHIPKTYATLQTVDLNILLEVTASSPTDVPPQPSGVHGGHPPPVGPSHMGHVHLAEHPPPWTADPELGYHQPEPAVAQTRYGPLAAENWQLPSLLDRQTGAFNRGWCPPVKGCAHDEAAPRCPSVPVHPHNKAAKVAVQPVHTNQHPRGILANRKTESPPDEQQAYVKKPPNAFMLFMKERRPDVVEEYNIKNNSDVNKILGKLWKSLSKREQAPYYERASEARRLHDQQNPNWSFKDNYGKKRKRERGKAAVSFTASASGSENTQQGKRMCLSSPQAGAASGSGLADFSLMSPRVVLCRLSPDQLDASTEDVQRRSACHG